MGLQSSHSFRRWLSLLTLIGLLSSFAQMASANSPKWAKVEAAQERLGQTHLLLGKIESGRISLVQPDHSLKTIEFPFEIKSTLVANLDANQSATITSNNAVAENTTDLSRLSVSYVMSGRDTKSCRKNRELNSFLSQLKLFASMFYEMEMTVSSQKYADCASQIVQEIVKKGFKVDVSFVDLKEEGGISVRAYLSESRSGLQGSGAGIGYDSLVLQVHVGPYRVIPVRINSQGYFVLSFAENQAQLEVDVVRFEKKLITIKIENLPLFALGESQKSIFDASSLLVQKSYSDSFKIEEIPESVLQAAVAERLKFMEQYSWSLKNSVKYRTITGTGLAKNKVTEIIPFSLDAEYLLNEKFVMGLSYMPELFLGESGAVKTNFLETRLMYALIGHQNRHYLDPSVWTYKVGFAGFYMQNRGESSGTSSVFLLSDLIGVAAVSQLVYQPNKTWNLSLNFDLVPFPSSQATKTTLSQRYGLAYEYCIKFESCVGGGISQDTYELDYIQFGKVKFSAHDYNLTYKYKFK